MMEKTKKLRHLTVVVASTIALGLSGCNSPKESQLSEIPEITETEKALQVVTTFVPMTQFTKAVAGDRSEVIQLLPTNTSPHDYQAKPSEVQAIAKADVLVKNGLETEVFLDSLIANAGNPNLKIIDSSEGIATLSNEEIEGNNHDHSHSHDHNHEGEYNPHIWLDPKRAIQQVENIRDGLIAADPEGENYYRENAAAYIAKLTELDQKITAKLEPFNGKTFVVFHDFAPYFAESYGLKATFLVDVPSQNPSPTDVKRVINVVEKSNLKTLLVEPQVGENIFSVISQDLNVKVSPFDPMETGDLEAIEPDYYLTTMEQNVNTLVNAFGGTTQTILPQWLPQPLSMIPQPVRMKF
jgi:zinc transport system substrate-binding protein